MMNVGGLYHDDIIILDWIRSVHTLCSVAGVDKPL